MCGVDTHNNHHGILTCTCMARLRSPRFTQATYDLFRHNCNNFSDELCKFLIGKGIPERTYPASNKPGVSLTLASCTDTDIINLPNEVLKTPLG